MGAAAAEGLDLPVLAELGVKQLAEAVAVERDHLLLAGAEGEQRVLLAGEHRAQVEEEAQVLGSEEVVEERQVTGFQ